MKQCQPSPVHLWGNTRRMDDLWIAFVPIGKKERSVRFNLICRCRLLQFLRCRDQLLDSLFLYVICDSVYVYVYYGSCAMRFGLCLDFVIGSCGSSLQMYCNPLTLMFAPSFVECLLRDLNFMFRSNVLQNPCIAGMV